MSIVIKFSKISSLDITPEDEDVFLFCDSNGILKMKNSIGEIWEANENIQPISEISNVSGGLIVDVQARATIEEILTVLRTKGFII